MKGAAEEEDECPGSGSGTGEVWSVGKRLGNGAFRMKYELS